MAMCIPHAAQGWCRVNSGSAECQHWPCCCSPGSPCLLCSLPRLTGVSLMQILCDTDTAKGHKWMEFASLRKGGSHRHITHSSRVSHQVRSVLSCQHRFTEIEKHKTAKCVLIVVFNISSDWWAVPIAKGSDWFLLMFFSLLFPLTDHRNSILCHHKRLYPYFILLFKVTRLVSL